MAANRRSFEVTSTASYVAIANFDTDTAYNHIAIENYTDGDVYIAVNDTTYPDMICKQDTVRVFDDFTIFGTMYVKNNTGTGGTVVVTVWKD